MTASQTRKEVPEILFSENFEEAVRLFADYFAARPDGSRKRTGWPKFSGSQFDVLGHAWDDPRYRDVVTPSDVLALSCLAVEAEGDTAVTLMNTGTQARMSELLRLVPLTASIGDSEAYESFLAPGRPMSELWSLLRDLPDMGKVRTSKLLARKRANLVPVYDRHIVSAWGLADSVGMWEAFHRATARDGGRLLDHATTIRSASGVG